MTTFNFWHTPNLVPPATIITLLTHKSFYYLSTLNLQIKNFRDHLTVYTQTRAKIFNQNEQSNP